MCSMILCIDTNSKIETRKSFIIFFSIFQDNTFAIVSCRCFDNAIRFIQTINCFLIFPKLFQTICFVDECKMVIFVDLDNSIKAIDGLIIVLLMLEAIAFIIMGENVIFVDFYSSIK